MRYGLKRFLCFWKQGHNRLAFTDYCVDCKTHLWDCDKEKDGEVLRTVAKYEKNRADE